MVDIACSDYTYHILHASAHILPVMATLGLQRQSLSAFPYLHLQCEQIYVQTIIPITAAIADLNIHDSVTFSTYRSVGSLGGGCHGMRLSFMTGEVSAVRLPQLQLFSLLHCHARYVVVEPSILCLIHVFLISDKYWCRESSQIQRG